MKLIFVLIVLLTSSAAQASCVILLHGLARTASSMEKLARRLSDSGYQTVNLGYPSRHHKIELLSELAISPALTECEGQDEVSFVTHSLGGILVRQYLSMHDMTNLKYVVMLGPPNKGSEVVDKLRDFPGFHLLNGDAGLQLGTDDSSIPNRLGTADFNVGIIAGNRSINWLLSLLIPGTDDGKVSIERTRLDGMDDHIVVPVTHPFLMQNDKVIAQVLHYLKYGYFQRDRGSNKFKQSAQVTARTIKK